MSKKIIYVVHHSHKWFLQDAMAIMGRELNYHDQSVTISQGRVSNDFVEYRLITKPHQLRGLHGVWIEVWGYPAGNISELKALIEMARST